MSAAYDRGGWRSGCRVVQWLSWRCGLGDERRTRSCVRTAAEELPCCRACSGSDLVLKARALTRGFRRPRRNCEIAEHATAAHLSRSRAATPVWNREAQRTERLIPRHDDAFRVDEENPQLRRWRRLAREELDSSGRWDRRARDVR
jgi:hypothetical protein